MALAAGVRLGPYEIQSGLGAGGMGEVYRARDTRLDRTVAIKVLPEALEAHPQFRERFEREARAVAALNHPHICTIHDVGEERGTAYLVMELGAGSPPDVKEGITDSPAIRHAHGAHRQERAVRQIRMLRAMRRELKRDYGNFYTGTQRENPRHSQGAADESPRQFPTLPLLLQRRKVRRVHEERLHLDLTRRCRR